MIDFETLRGRRLERWGQTPGTRIPDPEAAVGLIRRAGIVTLYFVSPEIPNLHDGYAGTPEAPVSSKWDSPSGHVYGWRWALGKSRAAFYTALVRRRPTWVSWDLLPAVLRLLADPRSPEELYDRGDLSAEACRIARALEEADGPLNTGDLRKAAGFPTGKSERAAYLKAVEELETRLLLCKVFGEGDEMGHALVRTQHPEQAAAADRLARGDALEQLLTAYLATAVYALPVPLAKHLRLPEAEVRAGLERLAGEGRADAQAFPGQKGPGYVARE